MIDEYERSLHDRATRGEMLSAEERSLLDSWYRRQDEAEALALNRSAQRDANLDRLHAEIHAALSQINKVTDQIQATADENARIRQEVDLLTTRLLQSPHAKAA